MNKASDVLEQTSRTFYLPISQLPGGLYESVMSAYLCMRAIDEIEDHTSLKAEDKVYLLNEISEIIVGNNYGAKLHNLLEPFKNDLKEVTLRLDEWIDISPDPLTQTIMNSTAEMSKGMAKWVQKNWEIHNVKDLDEYTYYVAGLVGVLLSDIWFFYEDLKTDKQDAIAFGRGLQIVNIVRNRDEDLERGVDFFPEGWDKEDMIKYAKENLAKAMVYSNEIKSGPIFNFCMIPLMLAHATLESIESGKEKLSRDEVNTIVSQIMKK